MLLVLEGGGSYSGELQRTNLTSTESLWSVVCTLFGSTVPGLPAASAGLLKVTRLTEVPKKGSFYVNVVRGDVHSPLTCNHQPFVLAPIELATDVCALARHLWRGADVLFQSGAGQSSKDREIADLRARAEAAEAALASAEEGRAGREEEVLRACAAVLSAKRSATALLQGDLEEERARVRTLEVELAGAKALANQHLAKIIRLETIAAAGGGGAKGGGGGGGAGAAAAAAASAGVGGSVALRQGGFGGMEGGASATAKDLLEGEEQEEEAVLGLLYGQEEEEEGEEEREGEEDTQPEDSAEGEDDEDMGEGAAAGGTVHAEDADMTGHAPAAPLTAGAIDDSTQQEQDGPLW